MTGYFIEIELLVPLLAATDHWENHFVDLSLDEFWFFGRHGYPTPELLEREVELFGQRSRDEAGVGARIVEQGCAEFSSEKNGLDKQQDGSRLNVFLRPLGHVVDLDEVTYYVVRICTMEDAVVSNLTFCVS